MKGGGGYPKLALHTSIQQRVNDMAIPQAYLTRMLFLYLSPLYLIQRNPEGIATFHTKNGNERFEAEIMSQKLQINKEKEYNLYSDYSSPTWMCFCPCI
jgi:hypothetical protein